MNQDHSIDPTAPVQDPEEAATAPAAAPAPEPAAAPDADAAASAPGATASDEGASDDSPSDDSSSDEPEAVEAPVLEETFYVRRRRRPTLITWVIAALVLPVVVGLAISPWLQLGAANEALNLALFLGVAVGVPLATIACIVDAVRHRGGR
ncbi:hypothetical protein ACXET9_02195 [Brachybacterium sp. DNPG3]